MLHFSWSAAKSGIQKDLRKCQNNYADYAHYIILVMHSSNLYPDMVESNCEGSCCGGSKVGTLQADLLASVCIVWPPPQ